MNGLTDTGKTAIGLIAWVGALTMNEWSVLGATISAFSIAIWMCIQIYYKIKNENRKKDGSESGE